MRAINAERIKYLLLLAIAFLLPFKFKGASLLPALFFIFWLIDGSWKASWQAFKNNSALPWMGLFYLLHIAGMIWTSNINDGLFDLQVKFTLLFFPLLFTNPAWFTNQRINSIIRAFIFGNLCALVLCVSRALVVGDAGSFFYVSFSWFMHPGYFSMYLCFCMALIMLNLVSAESKLLFNRSISYGIIAIFAVGILLLSSKTGIIILIALLLFHTYQLASKQPGKGAVLVFTAMIITALVLVINTPYIHDRIYEVKQAFEEPTADADIHSSVMRIQVWKSAMAIIREHPVLGTGTGDIKDELTTYYRQHGYNRIADTELNAHNQYLQSFAALGIAGFGAFIGLFVIGWMHARKKRNMLLIWLLAIVGFFSLFESVLEVQAGVMFLAFFLPLLVQYRPAPDFIPGPFERPQPALTEQIKRYATEHPLRFALWTGLFLRLIAVIFSRGFGMHDDHFLVIEASQAWVDGTDYDNWLPAYGGVRPDGHSFFYSGLHFIFFHILKFLGIADPQLKMLFVRLVHAVLSLATIYFGFKITYRISNLRSAASVGLLLALLWFMPWLSVRNLVEVACIPFLLWGTYMLIIGSEKGKPAKYAFYAGMLLGIAFSIRFQTVLFIGGAGLALLFLKRWQEAFALGAGTLTVFITTQAPVDYYIWGAPFAQFQEYVLYNLDNAYNYIVGPWYNYTLLILGILVPPVSLFIFFGWFRQWKKHLVVFLPVLIFLAFHSYFPNKQERFILPVVPFFIILGIPGWNEWLDTKGRNELLRKFVRGSWVFFWCINILMLPFITTMYSKRARVESMTYLYPKRAGIKTILMEDTNRSSAKMAPEFYLGKWIHCYELSEQFGYDSLEYYLNKFGEDDYPQYALFLGDKKLEERVAGLEQYLPGLSLETTIEPGIIDKVLYWLNPRNANDVIYIYRVTSVPERPPE